ncbi:alpha/beta-hydrolase [Dendrothele bispora CBS 962.96]|uniref:Alpha/beta-hydrolase n=1 Tax=Dendrothele bispora (strain CBS 962.96) TaxID=1314807 RepID=A0A4S8MPU1_DENBC|nr:alpha/beta-hydrolase [Dendrothele bispora CBS 962.96]
MAASITVSSEDFPTIFDPETCTRKGFCPVYRLQFKGHGSDPFETHTLYYEQHGTGPTRVVFVNGLNTTLFAWNYQLRALVDRDGGEEYSVLAFDSRGVGYSGYPAGRYTTSAMAEDVITLLDFIGWTGKHELHLAGTSFGGMIVQEVASRIPDRIASLVLAVTTPGSRHVWNNLPPWKGIKFLLRIAIASSLEQKVAVVMEMLFPMSWLAQIDENDTAKRTNREVQMNNELRREMLSKKQRLIGSLSQSCAALTHHLSLKRLRMISRTVPKIVILCGDDDTLMRFSDSQKLKDAMPEAELVRWKETGHGIHFQRPQDFHELLVRTHQEGKVLMQME